MAVKLLLNAGIEVHSSRVLLLCDNDFSPYIESGLRGAGANVQVSAELPRSAPAPGCDAVVVALHPRPEPVLGVGDAARLAAWNPPPVVLQYWGGGLRSRTHCSLAARRSGAGTHGNSSFGCRPGGLKVGEILWRARATGKSCEESLRVLAASWYGAAL